jgi:hypothetical protein
MADMHPNFPEVSYILRVKNKGHVLDGHFQATFRTGGVISSFIKKQTSGNGLMETITPPD